jgi:hypothetical protein
MSDDEKKPPAAVVSFPALKLTVEVSDEIAIAFAALALALDKTPEQLLGDAFGLVFDRYGKPTQPLVPKPPRSPQRTPGRGPRGPSL